MSDQVTYTKFKPSFAASKEAGCNHVLKTGQKKVCIQIENANGLTNTGTHTDRQQLCVCP